MADALVVLLLLVPQGQKGASKGQEESSGVEAQAKLNGLISLATVHVGNEDPTPASGLTEREIAFRVEALVEEAREEREADAKRKQVH